MAPAALQRTGESQGRFLGHYALLGSVSRGSRLPASIGPHIIITKPESTEGHRWTA